jgi:hypothetical protein
MLNFNSGLLNKPVCAIKAASSALAKLTSAALVKFNGTLIRIAAADMPALTTAASLATGEKNVVVFVTDSAGTVSNLYGTKSTTYAGIVFPTVNQNTQVVLGALVITAAATFTGGTTALDAANITSEFFDADGMAQSRIAL